MKTIIIIAFLITSVECQIHQDWVARLNGIGNNEDNSLSIKNDNLGNVYITGYSTRSTSNLDFLTCKYSTTGNLLWQKSYNGPGNSRDKACSLVLDDSNNVYVLGTSTGINSNWEFCTIKYSSLGEELWVKRYTGELNGYNQATSIAIDNYGNICVTGWSSINGRNNIPIIKYDKNGSLLWAKNYFSTLDSFGWDVKFDLEGNIYVTGCSGTVGYDYITLKYSSSGFQQWFSRYTYSGSGFDEAVSLAIDNQSNVYVTGRSERVQFNNNFDIATIKYNPQGVQLWVQRYIGAGINNGSRTVCVDNFGSVFVTGYTKVNANYYDYVTIKYDNSGIQQWVNLYNGNGNYSDEAYHLALDKWGGVYVTGYSTNISTYIDLVTIKYSSNGIQQWVAAYDAGGHQQDYGRSLSVDSIGNIYVTGNSIGQVGNLDYITIKYSQDNIGITPISNIIPNDFKLFQNFPNPFNPSTIIKFDVSRKSFITIKIYDFLGKEISTLVNYELLSGSYEVQWVAQKLSSGIYFCKMYTNDFVSTEKMIFIK